VRYMFRTAIERRSFISAFMCLYSGRYGGTGTGAFRCWYFYEIAAVEIISQHGFIGRRGLEMAALLVLSGGGRGGAHDSILELESC